MGVVGMATKISQLQCKEVICVTSGQRLGFIEDVEVEIPEGRVQALIVPGPCRFFGFLGRQDDYIIPWSRICRMGPDIVLVDVKPEEGRCARGKRGLRF